MATTTTNLGLSKPEYTDAADIAVINSNMDTLDSNSHTLAESIGKVVNGNKTAEISGIAIDEYVSLENSTIAGRTDGIYKAAKAIPYNTAIDSTYLSPISGGLGAEIKSVADRMGVLREVPFAVAVGDWSGSGSSFTANFNTQYVTATSKEISYFDSSYRTYAKGDINIVKKSGGGGITLTTSAKPTGTITGTILVFANSDGKIPVILEDTVTSIANGGTGQSSLAGAQQVLGITELNSKVAALSNRFKNLSNPDLNNCTTSGLYYCQGNTNGPHAGWRGFLLVIASGGGEAKQIWYDNGVNNSYERFYYNNTWSEWISVPTRVEFNSLNDKITPIDFTASCSHVELWQWLKCEKIGNVVYITGRLSNVEIGTNDYEVLILPAGYRPSGHACFASIGLDGGGANVTAFGAGVIGTDGKVKIKNNSSGYFNNINISFLT